MNMITSFDAPREQGFKAAIGPSRQALVVVASDDATTIQHLGSVCEFLDIAVHVVPSSGDLMAVLREQRPMAVISDVDGVEQDGYHTMKIIASYDRDLPVLLLTGGDPILMGAADGVQEAWGLTSVGRSTDFPLVGQVVDFLFSAGRRAGCMRLVQI